MREGHQEAVSFAQKVWEELLCFTRVRAKSEPQAEALVNEVLAVADKQHQTIADPVKFRAWLYAITTRVIIDHLRCHREQPLEPNAVDSSPPRERREWPDGVIELHKLLDLVERFEGPVAEERAAGPGWKRPGQQPRMESPDIDPLLRLVQRCRVRTGIRHQVPA